MVINPSLYGSLLHNGFQRGTICTKEAKSNGRLHPKFGTFLFLVDGFQLGEEKFFINRSLDTSRFSTITNSSIKESRLIVEFSVMYEVPPDNDLSSSSKWDDMIPYLLPDQDSVDQMEINKLMKLDLHILPYLPSKQVCKEGKCRLESREETRSRFTRVNLAKGIVSFVLKSRATEMITVRKIGDYSPAMLLSINGGSNKISASDGRERLLTGLDSIKDLDPKGVLSASI